MKKMIARGYLGNNAAICLVLGLRGNFTREQFGSPQDCDGGFVARSFNRENGSHSWKFEIRISNRSEFESANGRNDRNETHVMWNQFRTFLLENWIIVSSFEFRISSFRALRVALFLYRFGF